MGAQEIYTVKKIYFVYAQKYGNIDQLEISFAKSFVKELL